jgi:hypothetical protein
MSNNQVEKVRELPSLYISQVDSTNANIKSHVAGLSHGQAT